MLLRFFLSLAFFCLFHYAHAQPGAPLSIPPVYSNLTVENDTLFLNIQGRRIPELRETARYTLQQLQGNPRGTDTGIDFDFGPGINGTLYYGFIPYGDSKHPHPVYFRSPAAIADGKAFINIAKTLSGLYDMVGWQQSGQGTLGYRVVNERGEMLYDGIVSFKGTGPFEVDYTIIEGPFVNQLGPAGAVISFTTNRPVRAEVEVGGQTFADEEATLHHEIRVSGLQPATDYEYHVRYGERRLSYAFRTAPSPGERTAFTFAYASDSRSGQGGGERDLYGANFYIMKRILALCRARDAAFLQFTGDLINGYLTSPEETDLQYANWKRAVGPFWHYFPVYAGMGNHEALVRAFEDPETGARLSIDRFPFDTESAEAIFARNFVNPRNGPASEDGAAYDPDTTTVDFPSYEENVFYYTYGNVAVIVLNSDYFYAPSTRALRITSGGLHGYIMDRQLEWLAATLAQLEADDHIDHIFVTQHTPSFPNGGHVRDDMWYDGNNQFRPYVAGRPLIQGIIERRDQYLDLLVNKSEKVRAILTGDEHNYNRLLLTPETPIYPDLYFFDKIELTRPIYQINNGAAGAPYYAQEQTPWTAYVSNFTTQNALVFFHVEGKKVRVEVVNPDTLEPVDAFELK